MNRMTRKTFIIIRIILTVIGFSIIVAARDNITQSHYVPTILAFLAPILFFIDAKIFRWLK